MHPLDLMYSRLLQALALDHYKTSFVSELYYESERIRGYWETALLVGRVLSNDDNFDYISASQSSFLDICKKVLDRNPELLLVILKCTLQCSMRSTMLTTANSNCQWIILFYLNLIERYCVVNDTISSRLVCDHLQQALLLPNHAELIVANLSVNCNYSLLASSIPAFRQLVQSTKPIESLNHARLQAHIISVHLDHWDRATQILSWTLSQASQCHNLNDAEQILDIALTLLEASPQRFMASSSQIMSALNKSFIDNPSYKDLSNQATIRVQSVTLRLQKPFYYY